MNLGLEHIFTLIFTCLVYSVPFETFDIYLALYCLICAPVTQSWNEVNIDGGLVPEGRKFHSTACITTDPGSPKLLIIGGTLQNRTVSGEVWILDYHAKRWMMVSTI